MDWKPQSSPIAGKNDPEKSAEVPFNDEIMGDRKKQTNSRENI